MDNPYSAPTTELVESDNTASFPDFKHKATIWVIVLTVVTFGFYSIIWLYSRSVTLNKSSKFEPIEFYFMYIAILLFFVSNFLGLFLPYFDNNENLLVLSNFLTMISFVTMIIWVFKFRNRLNTYIKNNEKNIDSLNLVLTLVFGIFYLSYSINEILESKQLNRINESSDTTVKIEA